MKFLIFGVPLIAITHSHVFSVVSLHKTLNRNCKISRQSWFGQSGVGDYTSGAEMQTSDSQERTTVELLSSIRLGFLLRPGPGHELLDETPILPRTPPKYVVFPKIPRDPPRFRIPLKDCMGKMRPQG